MINLDIDVDIPNIPIERLRPAITLSLTQVATKVQNRAKENAPYLSWTLRSSIGTDYSMINSGRVNVWSNVAYARMREYNNRLNPSRRLYLTRARDEVAPTVRDLFAKNIKWALWI